MRRFRVLYDHADPIGFGALSFDAVDVTEALSLLARHHSRRPIELWCDGSFSGRVQRIVEANASYWRLLEWSAQWPRQHGGGEDEQPQPLAPDDDRAHGAKADPPRLS